MSALALFWPQPVLASVTDPLDAARDHPNPPTVDRLLEWAQSRVEALIGPDGNSNSTSSAAWYWFAPVGAEQGSALASSLVEAQRRTLVEALAGGSLERESADTPRGLDAHVEFLLRSLIRWTPESERPADLSATSALLGAGAPGNIAWRALKRLRRAGDHVTELGQWQAAAILASGLRTLFSPTRCYAAPRQPVRKPGHTRGRWCVLADSSSLLYRRGAAGRPRRVHPPSRRGVRGQYDDR